MSVEGFDFVIPSSDAERKQLRIMIEEAVGCLMRADGEREHKKEVIATIKEQFKIDVSIINKIIGMRHKQTYRDVEAKQEAVKSLYLTLFGQMESIDDDEQAGDSK